MNFITSITSIVHWWVSWTVACGNQSSDWHMGPISLWPLKLSSEAISLGHCIILGPPYRLPLFSLPHFYSHQYSTLFWEVRYFLIRSLLYFCIQSISSPSINSSVLILFLIGKVFNWYFSSTITSPPASVPLSHPFRHRSNERAMCFMD